MPEFITAQPAPQPDHTPGWRAPPDLAPPALVPLTPAEIGRLAELRVMPGLSPDLAAERDALALREGAPLPPGPAGKPDPAQADALRAEVWAHLVGLVEQIVNTVPQLHGLATRAAAMRAAWDSSVYHESPPPEDPPPSYESLPYGATRQEIEDRVKMLEGLPKLSDEQVAELARLKSTL